MLARRSNTIVEHPAGCSQRYQDISWKHPHQEIGDVANRVSGHLEDENHTSWGIFRHHLGVFFAHYGQIGDVTMIKYKAGIATGEVILQVTISLKSFMDIPDILMCWGQDILTIERLSTPLLVLWRHRELIESVPQKNPSTTTPEAYDITRTSDIEGKSGARLFWPGPQWLQ